MKELSPDDLSYLSRFGFDPDLFASWRRALREGRLSAAGNIVQGKMLAPLDGSIHDMPKQGSPERANLDALGEEAIRRGELGLVILNGGMATRFGGVVKGVVDVVDQKSFLELKIRDTLQTAAKCGGTIPIYLMNSFATDASTKEHLEAHDHFGAGADGIRCFTQFISVRMAEDGDIFVDDAGKVSPHGPGHGDFAPALRHSGCLADFLARGGKHLFVANVDNLGARVHTGILGHHLDRRAQVTVEVAPKWPGDVGGSPYLLDGKLQLVEQIRYPEGFDPDIVDVFNTNTFHFAAESLDRDFDLGWYYVEKKVDGRKAVQVERLIGEMTRFLKSNFLRVKRTGPSSRFFPIKTPEDLDAGREEIAAMFPRLLGGSQ
ncbi:MAG: UTP--glucose-1-phosphate uridylyltransferase [Planctomycetota bacterium]